MHRTLTRLRGLGRSLAMYYWPPGSLRRLAAFYGRFVRPGDLCFDIGAHVGNRSLAFARLGARVVAVEPQPDFARFLRHLLARRPGVVLEEVAIAASPGTVDLHLSPATPTVSTASAAFIDGVAAIPSFAGVRWDERVAVPATTLDLLIERHGLPDFLKLDIEGLEEAALAGLTRAPRFLSFEFLAGRWPAPDAASIGWRRSAAGPTISRSARASNWNGPISWPRGRLDAWLAARAGEDFSGDIYARRMEPAS